MRFCHSSHKARLCRWLPVGAAKYGITVTPLETGATPDYVWSLWLSIFTGGGKRLIDSVDTSAAAAESDEDHDDMIPRSRWLQRRRYDDDDDEEEEEEEKEEKEVEHGAVTFFSLLNGVQDCCDGGHRKDMGCPPIPCSGYSYGQPKTCGSPASSSSTCKPSPSTLTLRSSRPSSSSTSMDCGTLPSPAQPLSSSSPLPSLSLSSSPSASSSSSSSPSSSLPLSSHSERVVLRSSSSSSSSFLRSICGLPLVIAITWMLMGLAKPRIHSLVVILSPERSTTVPLILVVIAIVVTLMVHVFSAINAVVCQFATGERNFDRRDTSSVLPSSPHPPAPQPGQQADSGCGSSSVEEFFTPIGSKRYSASHKDGMDDTTEAPDENTDGVSSLSREIGRETSETSPLESDYPVVERRKRLPEPKQKEKSVSLWSIIKENVGKDLTRVCLPVYFNEPLSALQRAFEELEYSYLLDRAYKLGKQGDSEGRILNVAAFAVSGYASTEGRTNKPFNPLLGETYEAERPEQGLRFFAEKVSHHPTIVACHCDGRGWKFWGDSNLKSKFWGRSIQVDPVGILTLAFDDGEVFTWSKVTSSIYNIIIGKLYIDHYGTMRIQGNRDLSCKLKFKEQSIIDRNPHQVKGLVTNSKGEKLATLFGKWDENMYYVKGDLDAAGREQAPDPKLLWKRNPPAEHPTRYGLTSFAITLNELSPELKELLPPTDSRLRPDQRCLEEGLYDEANAEKLRLELKQRQARKLQETGWKPRWFVKEPGSPTFRYKGGYWEARHAHSFQECPQIFAPDPPSPEHGEEHN
ncbi:hypothetical protein CBR_g34321 [Chara braunii]|uniref:Oxysterol-binding protein n=1 Tax=Chara braunii TaxID=69332 RepID=A0A388JYR5_CHABU|nr:hypothetical protein CBR_g34321 [Chara braunii]|eukprot:GBG62950.1 hypothetical protein CBR_g34321 [Chara braunii]